MLNDKISSIIVTWKTPDILALENARSSPHYRSPSMTREEETLDLESKV